MDARVTDIVIVVDGSLDIVRFVPPHTVVIVSLSGRDHDENLAHSAPRRSDAHAVHHALVVAKKFLIPLVASIAHAAAVPGHPADLLADRGSGRTAVADHRAGRV